MTITGAQSLIRLDIRLTTATALPVFMRCFAGHTHLHARGDACID